jgi:beta-1,4-mannosyltransferase
MRQHLIETYGVSNVTILMDRPPQRYAPLNRAAQDLFLETLPETRGINRKRTKILVTSTSYTPDEPLYPVLSALLKFSDTDNSLPNILLLITGKGPMQKYYDRAIATSCLSETDTKSKCTAKMIWLEPDDYPRLLACADLGISLHTSSSGMDFPMKIVDLYGCGVPVCAIKFDAYESNWT